MNIPQNPRLLSVIFAAALALFFAGCARGDVLIDVHENGSSQMTAKIGLTHQAAAYVSSVSGEDVFASMEKELNAGSGANPQKIAMVKRWVDDTYQWIEMQASFSSVDELQKQMKKSNMESLVLQQENGLFKSRFILDAAVPPLSNGASGDQPSMLGIDPAAMVQIQYSVRMPGKIVETNGMVNAEDSSIRTWLLNSKDTTPIHIVSEVWNMQLLALGIPALGVVFALLVVAVIVSVSRRKPQIKTYEPIDDGDPGFDGFDDNSSDSGGEDR